MVDRAFWAGKRVFLTGHTGFKGGWLSLWLQELGATVHGYALPPTSERNLFDAARVGDGMESELGDIRDLHALEASASAFDPDIFIHMAAQPLVRLSYRDPVGTYSTNVMGTVHCLEVARALPKLRAIVVVTTDKCYENKEWVWGYRETEPMGGHDPYSSSKGCAELVCSAFGRSFFSDESGPALASGRAGNVIGGGDWSEDRLIPDVLNAIENRRPVRIRNPLATRPWQHVLEPLSGYLRLAEALWQRGQEVAGGWNFGPENEGARSVGWIVDRLVALWPGAAEVMRDNADHPHEARYLKLDISKARDALQWQPRWHLDEALTRIVDWQQAYLRGADMRAFTVREIADYVGVATNRAAVPGPAHL